MAAAVFHRLMIGLALVASCADARSQGTAIPDRGHELLHVVPMPYTHALKNPLKGLTSRELGGQEWATLTHHYIAWDEIEAIAADGVGKIRTYCDAKWQGLPEKNIKVIPRVYLNYPGPDENHWPKDMSEGDYGSAEFKRRLEKIVEKLGEAWDQDPRVAFVELGIFGKWGEHHSPAPDEEMQALASKVFNRAFHNKLVSVRQVWAGFKDGQFGEYWDSFAHYDQMWSDGVPLAELNRSHRLYETQYIGGEVAYDWGNSRIQPGASPTATLASADHRNFVANTIRWLHCTQLRWIADYNPEDAAASAGAEEIQEALGYRFVIDEATLTPTILQDGILQVRLVVRNVGSAPFYYRWPLEVSLLEIGSHQVVWRSILADADIRTWLPGDEWTAPAWKPEPASGADTPRAVWPDESECQWGKPPLACAVAGSFTPALPKGRYILAVAVLDPAGMLPSVRFATANYFTGGRHPIGIVGIGGEEGGPLPADFAFDDPRTDQSLHYLIQSGANGKESTRFPAKAKR